MKTKQNKEIKKGLALIKKANNLIESRYKFDIWETRIFLSVLAQININDIDFQVYRIHYKDVIKTFQLSSGQSYDLLREGAKSLMKKPLYANYEINGQYREKQYHIIRSIDYLNPDMKQTEAALKVGEYIDVTIDPDMKPLLLQLKEQGGFTFYEMINVVKLGVYPMRIYELLKQYQRFERRQLGIEEMKLMFELTDEYPLFANFYQRIIEPAIIEINQHTDIQIDTVEKIKKGKKVESLLFRYHLKEKESFKKIEKKQVVQPDLFSSAIEDSPLSNQLETKEIDELFFKYQSIVVQEFGVSPTVFITELGQHSEREIEKAIRVTKRAIVNEKAKNSAAFFIDALRKGYTDAKEEKIKRKDEVEKIKATNLKLETELLELEQNYHQTINDKIKTLTSENQQITLDAIEALRQNEILKAYFEIKEKALGRDLELKDFREDAVLVKAVKEAIIKNNPSEFDNITQVYIQDKIHLQKKNRAI